MVRSTSRRAGDGRVGVGDRHPFEADHATGSRVAGRRRRVGAESRTGGADPGREGAEQDGDRRPEGEGGPLQRVQRRMEHGGVDDAHRHDGRRHGDPDAGDAPLLPGPRIGAVPAPGHPAAAQDHAGPPRGDTAEQHRHAEAARRGAVEQPVGADADADEPAQQERLRRAAEWSSDRGRAAVAAGVHGRREQQRPVERVGHHREGDLAEHVEAAAGLPAQAAGGSHPLAALDELRRDAQRHGDGHPDLVERRRHRLQEALGVGEHVGGADAQQEHREAQPVVDRRQQALERHRPADADPGRRGREGDLGQREEDVGAVLAVEQHAEHDPDRDDDEAHVHVDLEPAGPRGVRAAGGHHVGDHRGDEQEQQRVGGAAGRRREPEGPQPPGARVQRAGQAHLLAPLVVRTGDAGARRPHPRRGHRAPRRCRAPCPQASR